MGQTALEETSRATPHEPMTSLFRRLSGSLGLGEFGGSRRNLDPGIVQQLSAVRGRERKLRMLCPMLAARGSFGSSRTSPTAAFRFHGSKIGQDDKMFHLPRAWTNMDTHSNKQQYITLTQQYHQT